MKELIDQFDLFNKISTTIAYNIIEPIWVVVFIVFYPKRDIVRTLRMYAYRLEQKKIILLPWVQFASNNKSNKYNAALKYDEF